MSIQADGLAPYAPLATVQSVIDRARNRGLPAPVNKDVLLRTGVPESLVHRTLQSLQILELVNEDGTWTENLEILRSCPENEFQDRLAEILRSVYADVFQYVDPAKDSGTAVRDAFRKYTPHGQQNRMVVLFTGLCQKAGIISADAMPKTAQRTKRITKRVILQKTSHKDKSVAGNVVGIGTSDLPPPLTGLLATLPKSDKGWTQQNRDRFIKAFETMLDYSIPIHSSEENEEPVEDES